MQFTTLLSCMRNSWTKFAARSLEKHGKKKLFTRSTKHPPDNQPLQPQQRSAGLGECHNEAVQLAAGESDSHTLCTGGSMTKHSIGLSHSVNSGPIRKNSDLAK